jgi:hypothetical protein
VIQIQPFHCSTIQDVMVDTPKSHKYRYALEYITCLHHIILDSSVPGQPAATTWRCGSGHGAVPWRVVGVCGGGCGPRVVPLLGDAGRIAPHARVHGNPHPPTTCRPGEAGVVGFLPSSCTSADAAPLRVTSG